MFPSRITGGSCNFEADRDTKDVLDDLEGIEKLKEDLAADQQDDDPSDIDYETGSSQFIFYQTADPNGVVDYIGPNEERSNSFGVYNYRNQLLSNFYELELALFIASKLLYQKKSRLLSDPIIQQQFGWIIYDGEDYYEEVISQDGDNSYDGDCNYEQGRSPVKGGYYTAINQGEFYEYMNELGERSCLDWFGNWENWDIFQYGEGQEVVQLDGVGY
ncbi:MAG: hypothetical protein EZS28_040751 [Streblomastix strix]|uniref:Uncharacterized protein n=1 Tax=Streblomastix strix TaxID=222440 RepID=A0A5J4U155_9EUKA|nr:MAG: hypothetical protein EZS28_040751 [Streblomastix strix]